MNTFNNQNRKQNTLLLSTRTHTIEIDVFRGKHAGLIIAEVEFEDEKTLNQFQPAPFLTREISDTEHLAGGVLSGKTFEEIRMFL